jgi:hypothetical protein
MLTSLVLRGGVLLRKITRAEYKRWIVLAREHGFVNHEGRVALGRFVLESSDDGRLKLRFLTPVPAGLYSEDLKKKTAPIMFDRTENGKIILPGRWWQLMFEKLSEESSAPPEIRRIAAVAARVVAVSNTFLPANTDTIEISAPDEDGNMLLHEALAPDTVAYIQLCPE